MATGLNLIHAISHRLRIVECKGEAGAEYTRIPEQMVESVLKEARCLLLQLYIQLAYVQLARVELHELSLCGSG